MLFFNDDLSTLHKMQQRKSKRWNRNRERKRMKHFLNV